MATVESFMRIAMIGSGYVGLVSGACLADFGHEVTCIDSNAEKIAALKRGEIPIYEPGLDQLVKDNVAAERMFFSTNLAEAVSKSDVVFIAVGTPSRRGDGHADLSYVYAVACEVATALNGFTVVARSCNGLRREALILHRARSNCLIVPGISP